MTVFFLFFSDIERHRHILNGMKTCRYRCLFFPYRQCQHLVVVAISHYYSYCQSVSNTTQIKKKYWLVTDLWIKIIIFQDLFLNNLKWKDIKSLVSLVKNLEYGKALQNITVGSCHVRMTMNAVIKSLF